MNCGEAIRVKDTWGANRLIFIAQCDGRFLEIRHDGQPGNGLMLADWQATLRELVVLTVPAKLIDKTMTAESTANGRYVSLPLTYPLSVKGLADLFGVPAGEVRAQLDDLMVQHDVA